MEMSFRKMASAAGPMKFTESLDISHLIRNNKEITAVSPMQVELTFTALPEGVVDVQGTLSAEADMLCSRCLGNVHEHLNMKFAEQFKQGTEPEEVEEEDDTLYVEEDTVNLVPFLEEYFLLHLPFAPLCKSDCKGLCPSCGTDLNTSSCDCDNTPIDPRLAGLKDFFK
ncbi:DUF177 domain-containing protein [Paenibacillus urinalis]|uniref:DUF177 domain-containing protein n=2 Tax=Paenibacillus TaxID=44249 RepID=A0AAX3N614_9BACL|nr:MULTISPECIES: DUF177 domain-containing protein [Paenibacillus]WDH84439.1 DUF177 domain-containing protein [Paenibacillus urinalis]WDH95907.1 DUF177 domain-containing protein [Paenibacillus urinalis]WDI04123.1 DUF177 domain-containing protein [Paenibacillus urinalis]GAK38561.1 hypothetical protein TCA2_0287 [Paenibacillus sp. TCA20]